MEPALRRKNKWTVVHPLLFVMFLPMVGFGQDLVTDTINRQVWIPFIRTYNDHDVDGFMALHHTDMMRVLQDQGDLLRYVEYRTSVANARERDASRQVTRQLDLHFTERTHRGNRAFEVGYYQVTITNRSGVSQEFYGLFHVVLVRENGTWRIWMDADTSVGADAEKFNNAAPISGRG
ncbi:MAG: DUF4440 domain-containing protein [Saprospiraceae bacterium]